MASSTRRVTIPAQALTVSGVIAARKRWKRRVLKARRLAAAVPLRWIGGRLYYILGDDPVRWQEVPDVPALPKPGTSAAGLAVAFQKQSRIRSSGGGRGGSDWYL